MHSSHGHRAPNSSTLNMENLEVLQTGGVGGVLCETQLSGAPFSFLAS